MNQEIVIAKVEVDDFFNIFSIFERKQVDFVLKNKPKQITSSIREKCHVIFMCLQTSDTPLGCS